MKKTTIAIYPDVRTYLETQEREGESVDETLRRLLNLPALKDYVLPSTTNITADTRQKIDITVMPQQETPPQEAT